MLPVQQLLNAQNELITSYKEFLNAYDAGKIQSGRNFTTIRLFMDGSDVSEKGAPHVTLFYTEACMVN